METMKKASKANSGYVLGWENLARISAVEGIEYSEEMISDLRDLENRKVLPDERRRLLVGKYGAKRRRDDV